MIILLLLSSLPLIHPQYFTTCNESTTRVCSFPNRTQYILNLKKGGSNLLSTADYDPNFMLCEEYNYNCGYIETPTQPISIASGIELEMPLTQLAASIPANITLQNQIKPYLNASNGSGLCVLQRIPLTLDDASTTLFFNGYMAQFVSSLTLLYTAQKKIYASNWSSLNINIKTAVIQATKNDPTFPNTTLWSSFLNNDYPSMINEFQTQYANTKDISCLHSAYLLQSVTSSCNKLQSINFLVDESGSIGAGPFQYARDFLTTYITVTNDDLSLLTINFFDSTYDPFIGFNNNRSTILNKIQSKPYRGLGTLTGAAINTSTTLLSSHSMPNGIVKILVILTDGGSYDSVVQAAENARAHGITLFCIGIGSNINNAQLLQIAGTQSNIININSFSNLVALVDVLSNYLCKQMIDIKLNDVITGNYVRVPTSPSFFRVEKGTNQTYALTISYSQDPSSANESLYSSQYNPFPDLQSQTLSYYRPTILTKVYYIPPVGITLAPYKKTLFQNITSPVTYVSVAANALSFNISLLPCSTANCKQEIMDQELIGSENYQNRPQENITVMSQIAAGVAALGVSIAITKFVAQKIAVKPDNQITDQHQEQISHQHQEINQNSRHNDNQSQHQSNRSHLSKKSGKNKKK